MYFAFVLVTINNQGIINVVSVEYNDPTTGRPGSSEVPCNLDTLGREFDPGKRNFPH